MTNIEIEKLNSVSFGKENMTEELALAVLNATSDEMPELFAAANRLRLKNFGSKVRLCSIVNAKSGSCSEDCAFCAQSAHHNTHVETYDMLEGEKLASSFKDAKKNPIKNFGIVTSGEGLEPKDIDNIIDAVEKEPSDKTAWCASLGIITDDELSRLYSKGVKRFHHNLETAESYFDNICTTHNYSERLDMVRRAKKSGMEVCCGGLLGLGESFEQRVELAFTISHENVDSIPLNFHIPVEGTRLEKLELMKPLDILKTIVMFRLVNPNSEVKISAGRIHLRDLQSMVFYAGATGIMIGDLLTVAGRKVEKDMKMLEDLNLEFEMDEH